MWLIGVKSIFQTFFVAKRNSCHITIVKTIREKNDKCFSLPKKWSKTLMYVLSNVFICTKNFFETFWTPDLFNFCTGLCVNCNLLCCIAPLSYWIWKNFHLHGNPTFWHEKQFDLECFQLHISTHTDINLVELLANFG